MKEKGWEIKVRDVMVEDVAYVTVPGTREELMAICKSRYISGVPVVKDGKLVGIVTRQDVLKNPNEEQIALLMTRNPFTIGPDASVAEASRLMLTKKIRRLPVVEGDRLVGIISVADIVRVIADMGITEPIGDYIADETVAVWDETPLSVVGRIMELANVKAVPVLNTELELVGLMTDRDLINAAIIEDNTEDSDLSLGADEDEWRWEGMRDTLKLYYSVSKISLPKRPVKEVMVKGVITAARNSTVSECAGVMSKNKFDQLPVISARGKLVGLLFDRNLLKVLV
ncbi:MAG: CBS domain-containing protein [Methanophagales archaeon]|nr:CBS domain-containing protein [Methanophagales archaeon]